MTREYTEAWNRAVSNGHKDLKKIRSKAKKLVKLLKAELEKRKRRS